MSENTDTLRSASPHDTKTSSRDLPPSRKSRVIKRVSPPLSKISLNKFIYTLTGILLLIGAFYSYRMVQHKKQVGGWWNLLMGKSPIPTVAVHNQGHEHAGENHKSCNPSDSTVEGRINALAEALGMSSPDLAHAIAGAVRHHVPPASLSSIAAKETGETARILTNDDETVPRDKSIHGAKESQGGAGIFEGVEKLVGMEDKFDI